ncbi:TonB-dependent siderophore receptor [Arcicella rosea]|uniref:Iron complex outermembrane receptor protein n=1 Tax=Arcicella rosea TaxID=502909 RepID=A0A841EQB9_9BACT|nr:TonB-dependent receptor [Arcicella rosea]MBB6003569.1 iron complex outermembrane receptor protein [Arcicella rosea]
MKKVVFSLLFLGSFSFSNAQEKDSTILKTTDLNEVIIHGLNNSTDVSSEFTSRIPLKNLENPQITHAVNSKLILNRNYFVQYNMLSNVTGVSPSWAGVSPYYTVRGFRTRSNFRNGILGYVASDIDPVNIAQLDVIKGPSGTLFGSSMTVFGGVINRVTVKPQNDTFTNLTFAGGNNNFQRATVDINTKLDEQAKGLLRITGAYTNKESFQDQGTYQNLFLAPSFTYKVNDKLTIEAEAEILRRVSTNNTLLTPSNPLRSGVLVNAESANALNLDYFKSYTDNSVLFKTTAINFYAKVNYKISNQWKSETNFMTSNSESYGNYQTMALINNNTSIIRRIINYAPESIINQQIQQNFIGDVNIGNVRNRVLIGFDFYRYSYGVTANGLDGSRANAANGVVRPVFDTVAVAGKNVNYGLLNESEISSRLLGRVPTITKSILNTYSLYVSDVINPVKNLSLMLSARLDVLDNLGTYNKTQESTTGKFSQTTFSPKLGLTYQIIPEQLAFVSSYMNGFQNVAPVSQVDGTVSNFKPQFGNQFEAGFKYSNVNHVLDASISYYNILVSNTVRANPANVTMFIQDGKQYSSGVEVDVQSRPFTGLYIHTGVAYNNSQITASDVNTEGLRPINSGPAWMGNAYVSYTLPKGLSFGLGGNYYGKDYIINSKSAGQFYTEDYFLLNGTVSYTQKGYVLALSGDNLLDKHYYYGGRGFITPGTLRQIILSLKLNF